MDWQLIETAPKNGTMLLLGCDGDDECGEQFFIIRQGWFEDGPNDRCWYDIDNEIVYPTHWAPMPAAPPRSATQSANG